MIKKITRIYNKSKNFGFIGPKYIGVRGKIKIIMQEELIHSEIVLAATPDTVKDCIINDKVTIKYLYEFNEFIQYQNEIDNAYYEGFTNKWEVSFQEKEILALGFYGINVAGFVWIQDWRYAKGCYYVRYLDNEYRTYRAGVLPVFRNKKIHQTMKFLVLKHLFLNGAKRVYVDLFKDNIPSLKTQMAVGYEKIFEIVAIKFPLTRFKLYLLK